jgi:hypothetical protein
MSTELWVGTIYMLVIIPSHLLGNWEILHLVYTRTDLRY